MTNSATVGSGWGAWAQRLRVAGPVDPAAFSERRKLLIFAIMAFGQFMALLDIQIVASSLGQIQAGLSAGPDEIAWVQTSYLMAEIVMIPLAAFLSQAISTRWLFTASAALFTLSSLMCGSAWNIESMIMFRAVQGFVGGAMVPTVFATGFKMFTGKKLAMIPLVLGLVGTLAPTIGPSVGGWITEYSSWRWLFFMNVLPGLMICITLPLLGRVDDARPSMLAQIDWLHVAGLAMFLGALQYMLEEGPRHDWFSDTAVATAALLSGVGALVFFERSFFSAHPVVRLDAFKRPTFALACGLNLVVGFGLYASIYLLPVFLGRVRGYSSLDIGTTVFVTGLAMGVGAPLAARLSRSADPRLVIAMGLALFALGLWLFSGITRDWGFGELLLPQAVRGFATLLCIVPAVGLALNGVAPAMLPYASGLFNLMRNLGGAIGIALVNTWLGDNARLHVLRLSEAMAASPQAALDFLAQLTAIGGRLTPDAAHAQAMAESIIVQVVVREALTQAFDDVFVVMAAIMLAGLLLVPFCKPVPLGGALPADAH